MQNLHSPLSFAVFIFHNFTTHHNLNFISILGFVAAFFTTFALLPQGLRAIKTKHTKDLSLPMLLMLEVGIILWLIYGIMINDLPLVFANGVGAVFATMNLVMKLKYG